MVTSQWIDESKPKLLRAGMPEEQPSLHADRRPFSGDMQEVWLQYFLLLRFSFTQLSVLSRCGLFITASLCDICRCVFQVESLPFSMGHSHEPLPTPFSSSSQPSRYLCVERLLSGNQTPFPLPFLPEQWWSLSCLTMALVSLLICACLSLR